MNNDYLHELNEEQHAAVTYDGGHALVLAGAGSGKTKTIVARATYLINSGIDPASILILSFTNKSAREIKNRIKSNITRAIHGLEASTFHAWCMKIVTQFYKAFGFTSAPTILDEDDKATIFSLMRARQIELGAKNLYTTKQIIGFHSFAVNTMQAFSKSFEEYFHHEANEALKPHLIEIFKEYRSRKLIRNYIDFDDLLQIVGNALEKSEPIRSWFSYNYSNLLIDEMQDTNPLQWKIIDQVKTVTTLFCVGDARQSIYRFRGADYKNIYEFTSRVSGSKKFELTTNYRATQQLLLIPNWLMNNSPLDYGPEMKAVKDGGEKAKFYHFDDEGSCNADILESIYENLRNGYKKSDHLVLARSSYSHRQIEASFVLNKIDYKVYGGTQLFQSQHVKDVISALRIGANPSDEIAWMRFLTLFKGIGDVFAKNLTAELVVLNNIEEMLLVLKSKGKVSAEIIEIVDTFRLSYKSLADQFDIIIKLLEPVLELNYQKNNWQGRKQDLLLLKDLVKNHNSASEFINEYSLNPIYEQKGRSKVDDDCVILSTIHSAKGLEADFCYVKNVNVNDFPSIYDCRSDEEIEESRRLLYVALTRAKVSLSIYRAGATVVGSVSRNGSRKVDHFLNDLPANLYQLVTAMPSSPNLQIDDGLVSLSTFLGEINYE